MRDVGELGSVYVLNSECVFVFLFFVGFFDVYNTFPSLDWMSLTGLNIIDDEDVWCSSLPVLLAIASDTKVSDIYKLYWNLKKENPKMEILVLLIVFHLLLIHFSPKVRCIAFGSQIFLPRFCSFLFYFGYFFLYCLYFFNLEKMRLVN